jgi:hypothetical protein
MIREIREREREIKKEISEAVRHFEASIVTQRISL